MLRRINKQFRQVSGTWWRLSISFSLIALYLPFTAQPPSQAHDLPDYTQLYPNVFSRQGPPLRRVALTFDDGPDQLYTPQILAILAREHVHATFFVLGENARAYPGMIARIQREGHALGNHTYDHPNLLRKTLAQLDWEVQATDRELSRLTGSHTRWFRAPYGNVNGSILRHLRQMGYRAVNWSVDSYDWRSLPASRVESNILSHTGPGAIILQHCAGNPREILSGTVAALPHVIHALRAQGYSFVTVPELLSPAATAVHSHTDKKLAPGNR